jgi:hypothetical protein
MKLKIPHPIKILSYFTEPEYSLLFILKLFMSSISL